MHRASCQRARPFREASSDHALLRQGAQLRPLGGAARNRYYPVMAISPFYRALRERVGTQLLLMPAVAAVIRDAAGRVLIQRTQHDQWSLPAGAIEPGESPAQTVVREVREETGLLVRAERVLAVWGGADCRMTYPNGDVVEYVVTVFDCAAVGGELIESGDETLELRWFAPEQVPPLGLPCSIGLLRGSLSAPLFAWQDDWLSRH